MLQKLKNLVLMLFIFKLVIILSLSPVLVNGDQASEEEIVLPDAGTTPDSPFYGLELAIERIQLALTFGNVAKAEKRLQHAEERLAEVRVMVEENKIKAAERARKEHGKIFAEVEIEVKKIDSKEARLKIERGIFTNRLKVVGISDSLGFKLKAKIRGKELTQEQVDAFFVLLEELEIEVEEIDAEVIEVDDDFKKDMREAALDRIEDAREEIEEAEEKLAEFADSERGKLNAAIRLLENAKKHLAAAEAAFEEGKFGMAFGQATAAKRIAKNALRILDRLDDRKEDELRIKASIKPSADALSQISRVKIKGEFFFEANDRTQLATMLLEKLSLSEDQVAGIIEFEGEGEEMEDDMDDENEDMDGDDEEDEEEDESRSRMEVKIKIRDGFARVKFEMRFFPDAFTEQAVIKAISMKLNALTVEDILNSIKSHEDEREKKIDRMRMREREMEDEEEEEDSDSLELEAKITIIGNTAEIKYEIGDDKMTFALDTSDEEEILAALAERTDYSIGDWRKVAEFKIRSSE